MSGVKLLLNSARGIYIPRDFVTECAHNWRGIPAVDISTCANPKHEWYWSAWETILLKAYFIDDEGYEWTLYQDGDLWAICEALMTAEEKQNFFGD